MKKILVFFFILFFQNYLSAQIHEIGVFAGGSNFIGDVGKTDYVSPNKLALGLLYKWNKSPRHSYRFSYIHSNLLGNDGKADSPDRVQRGYEFKNSINELSAEIEFNYFNFNLHDKLTTQFTPYIATGLSYLMYDELYILNGETINDGSSSTIALPIILGVKSNFIKNFVLAFEVGARYTFTDNLDGSYPKSKSYENLTFGNINSKDWYVFSGLTLTYTFGEKPCYCSE